MQSHPHPAFNSNPGFWRLEAFARRVCCKYPVLTSGSMQRSPAWIRNAIPGHNPAQTDKNQAILPPGTEGTDPFLFLMEDWFSKTGFDWHPHRGFETVTYVIDGVLEHKDNTGAHGILNPGDLQWTTTGSGVLHTEIAHEYKGVHTLQLWLNLPASKKMSPPRYQDLRAKDAPVVDSDGAKAIVFAGTQHGVTGKAELLHPAGVVDIRLDADGAYVLEVPDDHFAFVYCIKGAVQVGEHVFGTGQTAAFQPGGSEIPLKAGEESHLIAYHGLPIGEPVAQHGPFVMNTREEIIQTIRDYQNGLFGDIPA